MLKKFFFTLVFFIFIIFLINFNECDALTFKSGDETYDLSFPFDESSFDIYVRRGVSGDNWIRAFAFPKNTVEATFDGDSIINFKNITDENITYYDLSSPQTTTVVNWSYTYNRTLIPNGIQGMILRNNIYSTVYSDINIYNEDGSIFFNGSFRFDLNFIEEQNLYQIVSSNSISYDRFSFITATITDSNDNVYSLNWEYYDVDETQFVYYYDIYENGTYTINIVDSEKDEEYTFTINCTEIDEDFGSLNLYLSTEEQTTEPLYVLSNRYYYEGDYDASEDFLNNYDLDISYGYDMPFEYAPLTITGYDEVEGKNFTQYQFKIVVNGIYIFKILNFNTHEITYQTFNVDNIGVANKWGDDVYYNNYNENGEFDPTPVLFLEYVDTTTVRIRTQPFSFNEIIMLQCFTKFEDGDFSQNRNIYNYTIDTGNTIYDDEGIKQNNIDLYYFYLDVQVDGNYTFQFYNIELDKYTQSNINVNIREFVINNIDNIDSFSDKMIAWSKLHFGFLVYPFELAINIFGRVTNINFSEPVLSIPELKSPFDGTTFFSGVDFNFNSILNIGVVNTVYNIYLVVVDAIFIFLFVSLCKKVFGEVFK